MILSTWLCKGISGDVSQKPAFRIQESNRHTKLKQWDSVFHKLKDTFTESWFLYHLCHINPNAELPTLNKVMTHIVSSKRHNKVSEQCYLCLTVTNLGAEQHWECLYIDIPVIHVKKFCVKGSRLEKAKDWWVCLLYTLVNHWKIFIEHPLCIQHCDSCWVHTVEFNTIDVALICQTLNS